MPITFSTCSLRWYLLGKYSSSVFTEHRNTKDTNEDCLVNCLTACTVKDAEIVEIDSSSTLDITDETLSSIESFNGICSNFLIPECSLEILKEFEVQVALSIYPLF